MGFFNNKGTITPQEKEKLDKIDVGVKSNLNATMAPTITDDTSKGYSVGSTWIYNNVTYLCTDATKGNAVWASTADIYYFDTWATLIAAISVVGTTYVNKYAVVSNANNGVPSGVTYTAPTSITNPIVDGGQATYKILTQGANYKVACQARTVTNPVVTSVMLTVTSKPIVPGYYIFTVIPTDGLPTGVALNDIVFYNGTTWSVWQKYAAANTVLVCGSTPNTQITWRKFQGTWMSTADEFTPDGQEYQTGKLWNGKPVYRKCTQGTLPSAIGTPASTGLTIPSTGTLTLCSGTSKRNTSPAVRFSIGQPGTAVELYEDLSDYTIKAWLPSSAGAFCSQPYVAWVEYTKS